MSEPTCVHDTFVLEYSYPNPSERVFAAFADTARKQRWYAESKVHDIETFKMEFRVGGAEVARYRLSEDTPFPGVILSSESTYQDIVPNQRIVLAQTMTMGDRRISSALITLEFLVTGQGCDLVFTHQAAFFEGADGPEMRKDGWRQLFTRLGDSLAVA